MSQGYHHHPNCHSAAHHSTPRPSSADPYDTAAQPARDKKTIASEAGPSKRARPVAPRGAVENPPW